MGYLILIRHGESRWNVDNKFTGWVDVPLTEIGVHEAQIAAERLNHIDIDVAFTSKLVRAYETLLIILAHQRKTGIFLHTSKKRKNWSMHNQAAFEEHEIPIFSSDKINERYYGLLQGKDKNEIKQKYGEEQVFIWRRSYDIRPPEGESLKDVYKRAIPYFKNTIMKQVKEGKNVIVAAHGNSLRAIIKYIEDISDKEIPHLELPTGKPIIYTYENETLTKENHDHSFNRPVDWDHQPKHKPYKQL
ncbi:MAG: 2,3-bisphosphoglycerate-dependent phosphoglycerate mutase [Nanoarchaeota archaeon]